MGQARGHRPSKGASSLFLPTRLACPASQVACLGRPFPGQHCTNFFGNARGRVLKGPLFLQDNRSLVPLIEPTQPLPCWPPLCSGHLCQGVPGHPGLSNIYMGNDWWPSSYSCSHFIICSLCPMCGVLCQGLGIQQGMRPSDIIPLKKTDEKQISETWQVWEGGKSYGGKAGGASGEFWRRGVLRGLQGRPP